MQHDGRPPENDKWSAQDRKRTTQHMLEAASQVPSLSSFNPLADASKQTHPPTHICMILEDRTTGNTDTRSTRPTYLARRRTRAPFAPQNHTDALPRSTPPPPTTLRASHHINNTCRLLASRDKLGPSEPSTTPSRANHPQSYPKPSPPCCDTHINHGIRHNAPIPARRPNE